MSWKVVITGGSRGIGRAVALRLASEGAHITILAKTTEPHPRLEGTIYSVAEEINAAGGTAYPMQVDIREEERLKEAIDEVAGKMGGIDLLINNASAITLQDTESLAPKQLDLMLDINVRGTFLAGKYCLPWLTKSNKANIISFSPPLDIDPDWFENHVVYTISKYNMSLLTLGWAAEFKSAGIKVNSLWPRTLIATAAIANMPGGAQLCAGARKPEIMADAVIALLAEPTGYTGNFDIDELILKRSGVTDFEGYAVTPGSELFPDLYIRL